MGVEQAYHDLLDSNLELRIKLTKEETTTIRNKEKIRKLTNDIEQCELYIKYLEKNLISREDEIDRLKVEYRSTLHNLKKCQDHLDLKEEALPAQDNQIILLEDTVENLKSQILKISHSFGQKCNSPFIKSSEKKVNNSNNPSEEEHQENMALPDILRNIGRALDRVERFVDGDRSINPKNTLNGIRISITTIQEHMQRHVQDAINSQDLLNTANRQINDIVNTRNELLRRDQMMTQVLTDERRARQQRDDEINNLKDTVCENVYEKCWWKRRHTACIQQAQNLKRYYQQYKDESDWKAFWILNKYQKWKARELNSRQIILNLQNNPLGNMADARRLPVLNLIAPILAKTKPYTGQEPPDDYLDRLIQSISFAEGHMTVLETANVGDFDDAVKCNILKAQ